jgi:hypothetical protein
MIVGKVTQADERTKAVTMVGKGGDKVTLNFPVIATTDTIRCSLRERTYGRISLEHAG